MLQIINRLLSRIVDFFRIKRRNPAGDNICEHRIYITTGGNNLDCLIMGVSDKDIPVIESLRTADNSCESVAYGTPRTNCAEKNPSEQEGNDSEPQPDIVYIGGNAGDQESRIIQGAQTGAVMIFGPIASRSDIAYEIMALGGGLMADTPETLQHILHRLAHNPDELQQRARYITEWYEYHQNKINQV